ncbi:MAG: aspartate ammonia-lyase [Deltaproteobacteria bacterium]|nr:aspartate ammonia-lyase [Deltaproteobacteria bacterium]
MAKKTGMRIETDSLGARFLPSNAYIGIQTLRAMENFRISRLHATTEFREATAIVKRAAAEANYKLGVLDKRRARAIIKASDEIINGQLSEHFHVDVFQAGAGTSHNMNANEVIANRAIEILGGKKGDYSVIHPNDHVNMSQSTNDVIPTAMRIAALKASAALIKELNTLSASLRKKAREFDTVIKSGRTHLQDAVPIRLGQEFLAYALAIEESLGLIKEAQKGLKTLGIGGSAVGTGINTPKGYQKLICKIISQVSGITGLKTSDNLPYSMQSMLPFTTLSGSLKSLAIELIRISNDLRLLSSGPRTGLSEITLPALQPGSSIMPGKVNPVVPEMVCMVGFQVIGNDTAIAMAAQAGQLELNVMMPVINHNLLQSLEILTNAVNTLTTKCLAGIKADKKACERYFRRSAAIATILNPLIGYSEAAKLSKEAVEKDMDIATLIIEKGLLTKKELEKALSPTAITSPGMIKKHRKGRR